MERKRPRPTSPSSLHQTQIQTLRTQLTHAQSMRSLESKSHKLAEERLKRQLADVIEEMEMQKDIMEGMRSEMEGLEGQLEEVLGREDTRVDHVQQQVEERECSKCIMLQQRLDASSNQVEELNKLLAAAEEKAAAAEMKASNAELKLMQSNQDTSTITTAGNVNDENCTPQILRATRLQLADTERANRELTRQNTEMKVRLKEFMSTKEKLGGAQRTIIELEKEVSSLQHRAEAGYEVERRWMDIRKELMEEGLVDDDDVMETDDPSVMMTVGVPPEIATVVRKFQGLKHTVKKLQDENDRLTTVSEERTKRCIQFEKTLKEKSDVISTLEKEVKTCNATLQGLELENKKILAQQDIWKRESEGMRSLLDTYEMQETQSAAVLKSPKKITDESPAVKGLQLSLKSARDEMKLLSDANARLESEIDSLKSEKVAAQTEHERVLDKFGKLRTALMEERGKAQAAEERACKAETLAGKGSYNVDTTRVLHLESNPLSNAIREKYQAEIDSLKQKLEQAEQLAISPPADGTTTPAPSTRSKGSLGSGATSDGLSSLDAQKLHKRLKERFKEQIGLFREGVYLLTGCKIDMSFSDSDCPHFKVRSMYSEREEDHLMFQWNRKNEDNDLDLMSTDLAQLVMNGPSAIYMTKFCSVPAFMASVTLQMFEKQTMI